MAIIIVMGRYDGDLELTYLYGTNPVATRTLINRVAEDIMDKYPRSRLIFDVVGDHAAPIAEKLFPYSETVPVYESVW